jgi:hypothetical protein|tara:strand:- start:1372 stop:1770 length:399 start_codon:yes stop_codon:yes gene_type:complete
MNSCLLATFILRSKLLNTVSLIHETYSIISNQIFVLQDTFADQNLILTYNVEINKKVIFDQIIVNTIRVHRKKDTNTLYSVNALNEIVKLQNNGILDKSFIIDWTDYTSCILTVNNGLLKKTKTKLERIIKI